MKILILPKIGKMNHFGTQNHHVLTIHTWVDKSDYFGILRKIHAIPKMGEVVKC